MKQQRSKILISLFLILTTLAVYWQVNNHDFVDLDDNTYVTENPHVRAGWSIKGLVWALTTDLEGHWHPLTWLSHMTDCQLFGLDPRAHHLIGLILHLLNVLLLFFVLRRMTGALFRSAFVAALFALHPLHVEPVAWVAGRKDVLSAFFWMLTLWTYILYSERPVFGRYVVVLLLFVMGLMAKSTVVTLPAILFLLDYWPLKRFRGLQKDGTADDKPSEPSKSCFQHFSMRRLIGEKLVLFLILAAAAVVAIYALLYGRPKPPDLWNLFPTKESISFALTSYVIYMGKMFWPSHLAFSSPYPEAVPLWQALLSGMLLIFISVPAVFWARKRPYFIIGWLWYLVTLAPVIRLLNIGPTNMADRYTYIPLIGLFIIITWGIPDVLKRRRYRKIIMGISAGLLLLGLMITSTIQVGYWKNSRTLFSHAISATKNNWLAHYNMGWLLLHQEKPKDAVEHLLETVRIMPDNTDAHNNLGNAYVKLGKPDEAVHHYTEALRIRPESAEFHSNLGIALELQGNTKGALHHYSEALRIKPNLAKVHNNLGNALKNQSRMEGAVDHLSEAVRLNPYNAEYHHDLGLALARQEKLKEAVTHFREAVRIKPGDAEFHNNLAIALELQGKSKKAVHHYREAVRIRPDYGKAHYNLGNTLRRQGKLQEAVKHLKEAVRIKPGAAEFHNTLGIALAQQRNYKEAIEHFSEAVRLKPGYKKALENLELVLRLIGKSAETEKTFESPQQ
jgi:Flp pilus assembly protein TadD